MELAGLTECEDRRVFNLPELILSRFIAPQ